MNKATDRSMRVRRAWHALIERASQHRTMTYEEIAVVVGWRPGAGRAVGKWILEPIRVHCERNGLPPLTSLVVRKGSRRPGRGLLRHIGDDVYTQQFQVFAHYWAKPKAIIRDGSNGEGNDAMSTNTGGAAVQRPASMDRPGQEPDPVQVGTPSQAGMSLRDWFAGQALQGELAKHRWTGEEAEDLAILCYHFADAMLKVKWER